MLRKNASGLNEPMNMPKSAPATPTKNAEMTNAIVRSPGDADTDRARGRLVLARGAQPEPDPRALKQPRRGHRREGPGERAPDRRRGRDPGHAGRAVRHLLPVPRDDVDDAEHGERREARGEAREAREREREDEREGGRDRARGERRRKRIERARVARKPGRSGQDERLVCGGITRIALVYAPIAMNAACPNEKTPETPTNM